jgi:hypothetical protein
LNSRTKYILLTLGILALGLLIFNNYYAYYWYSNVPELELSKVLFAIGLLCFGLYFVIKKWMKIFTKLMIGAFSLCLAQNLYLVAEYYREIQSQNRLSEYYELESCEKMENRFAVDLKKGELKYFHFGLGGIMGMKDIMKSKYDVEYYSMGCLLRTEMECYNKLVDKYLKVNYNKSLTEISKETDIYKLIETE